MQQNKIRKQSTLTTLLLLLSLTISAQAQSPWRWESKTVKAHSSGYSFEWTLPRLLAAPGDALNWQKQIEHLMENRKAEFLTEFENARADYEQMAKEQPNYSPPPWSSSCTFKIVWSDPQRLIILWDGYDFRGGAHGMPILELSILDRNSPDSIQASPSLFKDPAAALAKLSKLCQAKLATQIEDSDRDWIKRGTEPKWENFTLVFPSHLDGPARFEVIFPPYQVAPYAVGSPTVTIPWQELAPLISGLKGGVSLP